VTFYFRFRELTRSSNRLPHLVTFSDFYCSFPVRYSYIYFHHSGLSGSTAAEIQAVDATFIQEAQIGQSLTPGRNNGFLNMLAAMKNKAGQIAAQAAASGGSNSASAAAEEEEDGLDLSGDRPMYNGMVKALSVLKPTVLDLVDNSDQHAGHEGSKGFNGESHFDLYIVTDAFDGLNLVKRHKLVYMLLGEIMPKIHALQISAKTPAEVQ
jgi:stress-induced morphogen